jgi:prepilin-type N-terminal cleavage/methylation domain-containing protein
LTESSRRLSAFTIVELLVVIVVIAILATITIVSYTGITKQATTSSVQSNLKQLATTIDLDHASTGTYPATSAAINSGKGFPQTSGIAYSYNSLDNNTNYCASATSTTASGIAYHYTPKDGQIKSGDCGSLALSCPSGFISVPSSSTYGTSNFCVMKYEAKNVAGVATSQAAGLPWDNISQTAAATTATAACSSCHLITEAEWMTIVQNVLGVASNWSGNAVGSGYIYSGHNDNSPANSLAASSDDSNGYYGTGNSSPSNQRRTLALSNGEVIWDLAGNAWEWTSGTFSGVFPTPANVWTEWSNGSLVMNDLSVYSRPSYGVPAAVAWNSLTNGIGQLNTSSGTGARGLLRGGSFGDGASAGVSCLFLGIGPLYVATAVGFRVTES